MKLGKRIRYKGEIYELGIEIYDPDIGYIYRFFNSSGKAIEFSEKEFKELKSKGVIK